jgi:lysophospholipase L1-like esterase
MSFGEFMKNAALARLPRWSADAGSLIGKSGAPFRIGRKEYLVALLGNSLSRECGPNQNGNTLNCPNVGWFNWLNPMLDNALTLVLNAGVAGDTAEMIWNRVDTVIASPAQYVFCEEGTNDAIALIPLATTTGFMKLTWDKLRANGKTLILQTTFPLAKLTLATSSLILQYGDFMREYARLNPDVILLDGYSDGVDPLSTLGYAKANYIRSDLTHLTPLYGRVKAKNYAAVLKPIFPSYAYHVSSVIDTRSISPNSRNIAPYSLMTGARDGVKGAGVTNDPGANGGLAHAYQASCTGTATAVVSVVPRADGFGNDQVLVMTSATNFDTVQFASNDSMYLNIANLDQLQSELFVEITGASNIYRWHIRLAFTCGGVSYDTVLMASSTETVAQFDQSDMPSMPFRTPILTVPAAGAITGATMTLVVTFGPGLGGATFKVGRHYTRKVN